MSTSFNLNLKGEHWKDNLIGEKLTPRLDQRIHRKLQQEHTDFLLEHARRHPRTRLGIHETVTVTATDHKGKIRDIGFNVPGDLILANFGTWLAGFIRQRGTGSTAVSLTDTANTARSIQIYKPFTAAPNTNTVFNSFYASNYDANIGTAVKLGDSDTAPARTDYEVGSALPDAPESGLVETNSGSYAAGTISFSGSCSAGGASTAKEAGFYATWYYSTNANTTASFMLFHDLLSPAVAYTAGQTLTTSYSISL